MVFFVLFTELLVSGGVHERVNFFRLLNSNLGNPGILFWALVDDSGLVIQGLVHFQNLPAGWANDVRHSLHTLETALRNG